MPGRQLAAGAGHAVHAGTTGPKGCALRLLITGASGLLGGALAGHMAALGHGVVALTGRKGPLLPGGAAAAERWTGGAPGPGQVLAAAADLRRDGLGLEAAALRTLAGTVDIAVHCAGVTGFDLDADTYRTVNVDGTARMVALAEAAGLPLLHVSTAYVCGERDGPVAEAPVVPGTRFANGYEASKAAAEGLVLEACGRGLVAAVARPSIVVGAWADGAIARFDKLYGLMRLVSEGRVRTLPAPPGASLDLVPIDHVVRGLAHLAGCMAAAAGWVVHLVSGAPVPVSALRDLALAYPQFEAPVFVPPAAFDPATLPPTEALWFGRVAAQYATYLQRDPRFAAGALQALGGEACPPVDGAFLRRMIDRCVADGFLRGPQRTSG